MREIGTPSGIIIFFYTAGIFAVIFFLAAFGFSSNAIITVACSLALAGAVMMLWHFLRANVAVLRIWAGLVCAPD